MILISLIGAGRQCRTLRRIIRAAEGNLQGAQAARGLRRSRPSPAKGRARRAISFLVRHERILESLVRCRRAGERVEHAELLVAISALDERSLMLALQFNFFFALLFRIFQLDVYGEVLDHLGHHCIAISTYHSLKVGEALVVSLPMTNLRDTGAHGRLKVNTRLGSIRISITLRRLIVAAVALANLTR